jgi:hypothetical protein
VTRPGAHTAARVRARPQAFPSYGAQASCPALASDSVAVLLTSDYRSKHAPASKMAVA